MKNKILQRIDIPEGRAYVLIQEGKEPKFFPSVTSVLSLKESNYLQDLETKIGKDELKKISSRAALRGTAMHKFLENYMICMKHKGNSDSCLLYTQRKSTDSLLFEMEKERVDVGRSLFYNVFHSGILSNIKRVIFTEKFLYSESVMYAGTTDFGFIDNDKKIVIVDFKSASSERPFDVIEKYKCQAAAYTIAFEEMYKKPVERGEIWIAHPDGLQVEKIFGDEMELKKREFSDLCKIYHSMWNIEPFRNFIQRNI